MVHTMIKKHEPERGHSNKAYKQHSRKSHIVTNYNAPRLFGSTCWAHDKRRRRARLFERGAKRHARTILREAPPNIARICEPILNTHHKAHAIAFMPHLPFCKFEARSLRIGAVTKMLRLFREPEQYHPVFCRPAQVLRFPINLPFVIEIVMEIFPPR